MEEKTKYPYNYSKRIATDATKDEIIWSIIEMQAKIDRNKLTPEIDVEISLKYARLKFINRNYDEAESLLAKCVHLTSTNGLPVNHEIYYWKGRVKEAQGNHDEAEFLFNFALKKHEYNPNLISKKEILEAISKYILKN